MLMINTLWSHCPQDYFESASSWVNWSWLHFITGYSWHWYLDLDFSYKCKPVPAISYQYLPWKKHIGLPLIWMLPSIFFEHKMWAKLELPTSQHCNRRLEFLAIKSSDHMAPYTSQAAVHVCPDSFKTHRKDFKGIQQKVNAVPCEMEGITDIVFFFLYRWVRGMIESFITWCNNNQKTNP